MVFTCPIPNFNIGIKNSLETNRKKKCLVLSSDLPLLGYFYFWTTKQILKSKLFIV